MPESRTQSKFIVTRASPPSPEKEGRKLRVELRVNQTIMCSHPQYSFNMQIVNQTIMCSHPQYSLFIYKSVVLLKV